MSELLNILAIPTMLRSCLLQLSYNTEFKIRARRELAFFFKGMS